MNKIATPCVYEFKQVTHLVPGGRYTRSEWVVFDASGDKICSGIKDEPTARHICAALNFVGNTPSEVLKGIKLDGKSYMKLQQEVDALRGLVLSLPDELSALVPKPEATRGSEHNLWYRHQKTVNKLRELLKAKLHLPQSKTERGR
jgi:hypothetical protein